MKTCFKCGETRPLDDFHRHRGMKDGRLNKCKDCTCAYVRRHRQELEVARDYDRTRSRSQKRKKHLRENAKRWRRNNPERAGAHSRVSRAVRSGRLAKPSRCSRCGTERLPKEIHAHHEDYSKPLDVTWLCARCHAGLLRVMKEGVD